MTKARHPTLAQVLRRDRLVISIVLGALTLVSWAQMVLPNNRGFVLRSVQLRHYLSVPAFTRREGGPTQLRHVRFRTLVVDQARPRWGD